MKFLFLISVGFSGECVVVSVWAGDARQEKETNTLGGVRGGRAIAAQI